jgi:hypothetical protein
MGLFSSASGKQVDDFAKSLARELAERWPPATGETSQRKVSQKKLISTLERIYNKAIGFKDEHGLGIYKKARLGNTFRWELQELGYDKEFVENVTQRLVVYITRKSPGSAKRESARP